MAKVAFGMYNFVNSPYSNEEFSLDRTRIAVKNSRPREFQSEILAIKCALRPYYFCVRNFIFFNII